MNEIYLEKVFLSDMTADDKYFLLHGESLMWPIQIPLSKKQKTFSDFFSTFLKYWSNFEYFERIDDPHRLCISEITDYPRRGLVSV